MLVGWNSTPFLARFVGWFAALKVLELFIFLPMREPDEIGL